MLQQLAAAANGAAGTHATASHPKWGPADKNSNTPVAAAVALALSSGGDWAQSSGGNAAVLMQLHKGNRARAKLALATRMAVMQGTNAGANGGHDMNGTTEGYANHVTTAAQRVSGQNRPPGTPVQAAANKGSTDWSDQPNCGNIQRQPGTRNRSSGGG